MTFANNTQLIYMVQLKTRISKVYLKSLKDNKD